MIDPVCTTYYSDMARVGRSSIDPVFIFPVRATYTNRDKASNTYSNNTNKCTELSKQGEIINVDSFPYDQSALNFSGIQLFTFHHVGFDSKRE